MNVCNCRREDVLKLEPGRHFDSAWKVMFLHQNTDDFLEVFCRSLFVDGELVGIGGVMPLVPGTGEVWMALAEKAYETPIALSRRILELIALAQNVIGGHRLQMTIACEPEMESFRTFVERCGFRYEGTLHSYYEPGRDYWLFARVRS